MEDKYFYPDYNLLNSNDDSNEHIDKDIIMDLIDFFHRMKLNAELMDVTDEEYSILYAIKLGPGVRVSKLTSLEHDLSVILQASEIDFLIPIPGTSFVGIQAKKTGLPKLLLGDMVKKAEFTESGNNLEVILGRTFNGKLVPYDFGMFPHLLVSGTTGSGKSCFIDSVIISLLLKASCQELKFVLIDTHKVSFSYFRDIPNLLIPIVTDASKAVASLNWIVNEMMNRYKEFSDLRVRDLDSFNAKVDDYLKSGDNAYIRKPHILIVIDDFADLMTLSKDEAEESVCKLAQMSRAAGIHLLISTQRPSVNVLTGLIKANVPNRIAFAVASGIDSKTILDEVGAEHLKNQGEMLLKTVEQRTPLRIQGPYVSEEEVKRVVGFICERNGENNFNRIEDMIRNIGLETNGSRNAVELDDYFEVSGRFVIENRDGNKASVGSLQRLLKISFSRAAGIMDQLHKYGVVGESEGTKARKVLMDMDEFERLLDSLVLRENGKGLSKTKSFNHEIDSRDVTNTEGNEVPPRENSRVISQNEGKGLLNDDMLDECRDLEQQEVHFEERDSQMPIQFNENMEENAEIEEFDREIRKIKRKQKKEGIVLVLLALFGFWMFLDGFFGQEKTEFGEVIMGLLLCFVFIVLGSLAFEKSKN